MFGSVNNSGDARKFVEAYLRAGITCHDDFDFKRK